MALLFCLFIQKWYNITENSGGVNMFDSDPPGHKLDMRYSEPPGHNPFQLGDPEGKYAEPPPSTNK